MAAAWGTHLPLLSPSLSSCARCTHRHCDYAEHLAQLDDSAAGMSPQERLAAAPPHLSLGGVHDITGHLWDRCPIWYRDQWRLSPVAAIAVRWARRWAPGISELTPCGDDVISLVKAVDSDVSRFLAEEESRRRSKK